MFLGVPSRQQTEENHVSVISMALTKDLMWKGCDEVTLSCHILGTAPLFELS